jgi:outer membrane protein assembly factor BamB
VRRAKGKPRTGARSVIEDSALSSTLVDMGRVCLIAVLTVFLAAAANATAQEPWGTELGGPGANPRRAQDTVGPHPVVAWISQADGFNGSSPTPVADGGRIFAGVVHPNVDFTVYAIDPADGHTLWSTAFPTAGWVAAGDGMVVVTGSSGVSALSQSTGAVLWTQSTPKFGRTPVVADGSVVLRGTIPDPNPSPYTFPGSTDRHYVFALDAQTGAERWRGESNGSDSTQPLVGSGHVYYGLSLLLAAAQLTDGEVDWQRENVNSAVLDAGTLFVTTGNAVEAVDATSGATLWSTFDPYGGSLAADGSRVYTNGLQDMLHAYDRVTGKAVWTTAFGAPSITVEGAHVYGARELDAGTGREIGSEPVHGVPYGDLRLRFENGHLVGYHGRPDVLPQLAGPSGPVLTGERFTLDATGAIASGAYDIATYAFDLDGDGRFERKPQTSPLLTASYRRRGTFRPRVRVTDTDGVRATASVRVVVRLRPPRGRLGLTIDDGAVSTRSRVVTLSPVWPRLATHVLLSNDGGFRHARSVRVAKHIRWGLARGVPGPRTVYMRLRGHGTYTDDILLRPRRR